ncbi:hypothetical protein FRB93_000470 [Tulasnella sp. JGI-2019a]|nr:hypothetical protein FRB93_000470 [Tulasnella sp. JGI-2019a]
MSSIPVITSCFALAVSWLAYKVSRIGQRASDLPPGPPTKPLLGNILKFPTQTAHLKFTEWSNTYGEIFSLKIASSTVVVLNSPQAVREVMESKVNAPLTADRPQMYVAEFLYRDKNVAFFTRGNLAHLETYNNRDYQAAFAGAVHTPSDG